MAREKDGYRNALVRCITTLSGWITSGPARFSESL